MLGNKKLRVFRTVGLAVAGTALTVVATAGLAARPADGTKDPSAGLGAPRQGVVEEKVTLIRDEHGSVRWKCRLRQLPLELFNPRSHELLSSPDLTRIAYAALVENEHNQMIIDGIKGKPYDRICV